MNRAHTLDEMTPQRGGADVRPRATVFISALITATSIMCSSAVAIEPTVVIKQAPGANLTFSPDSRFVASADRFGQEARIWNARTGQIHRILKLDGLGDQPQKRAGISLVAFSPDGKTITGVGASEMLTPLGILSEAIRVWDLQTGRTLWSKSLSTRLFEYTLWDFCYLRDSEKIVYSAGPSNLTLLDVTTGKKLGAGSGYMQEDGIREMALTPDGKTIICLGYQASTEEESKKGNRPRSAVILVDAKTLKMKAAPAPVDSLTESMAVAPTGSLVALMAQHEVLVFDLREGRVIRRLLNKVNRGPMKQVVFASDGHTLFVAGYDIIVCDARSGSLIREIEDGDYTVYPIAISRDGKTLATGCSDGAIRLWNAAELARRENESD